MRGNWRIGRRWSEGELRHYLDRIASLRRNFKADPDELPTLTGWYRYGSASVLGRGPAGAPKAGGPFERACDAMESYAFSDPRIVRAHYDEGAGLLHRSMLLELQAFRIVRFLTSVRVGAVRSESRDDETVFGFRYDTLEGHIERGVEWFVLRKDHDTGDLRFRISASWQPGDFPNWWSRAGFQMVGKYYQKKWHRRAHEIMARIVQREAERPSPGVAPESPRIVFERRTLNA